MAIVEKKKELFLIRNICFKSDCYIRFIKIRHLTIERNNVGNVILIMKGFSNLYTMMIYITTLGVQTRAHFVLRSLAGNDR